MMYRHRNSQHNGGITATAQSPETAKAADVLVKFIAASTFKSVLHHHRQICELLKLRPNNIRHFYPKLRAKLKSWKAQALWTKFDKRAGHKCYNHGKACADTKVLLIGAGPCGLRTAIEAQLLGAQVVVVEKRDRFSRNNVLHLWPFVITDLKALGAKKFYGKFCAGSIDHISIRQLQCILLKVALLLGVKVFEGLGFEELLRPPENQTEKIGWRARFSQPDHSLEQYEFDVLIGADGKRNTLSGFKRTEFRGKLAIAVTANFINKRTELESSVQEISGVAFIFNQKFFKEMRAATGIDLENIVYYKDETHYFVMTAKKHSLIDKGVIKQDLMDTQQLLHPNNVDREALQDYAREAADFSTNYQMPHLDFAVNHYGHPDVAMFDFTSMFAAENACRAHQAHGHRLLMGMVGDSLLEPFWPTGSGCARGFLSAFDAAWMMRSWAALGSSGNLLDVLAERESIYRQLAQTTPRNLSKDHGSYTLEPCSRYPTINTRAVLAFQVRHLFSTDEPGSLAAMLASEAAAPAATLHHTDHDGTRKRKRRDSLVDPGALLNWCQRQVSHLPDLSIQDMSTSFKNGMALCGILHRYRPELIPYQELSPDNAALNNKLAFDILETEFGVPPVLTCMEMAACDVPDKLSVISYLSQVHHILRGEVPHVPHDEDEELPEEPQLLRQSNSSSASRAITCRIREDSSHFVHSLDKRNKKYKTDRLLSTEGGAEPPTAPGGGAATVDREDFDDRVKYLEAKFKGEPLHHSRDKKPKDMMRAIGRLEKTDWNLAAIERKIEDNPRAAVSGEAERVPKWNKQSYEEKMNTMERRLRANGEKEETIAKYKDVDAYLKRLEKKLREGSTLDVGLKGHNKVSNLASQLSSKLTHPIPPEKSKASVGSGSSKAPVVVQLPATSSDLCYFCNTRVYLVERLSAEGKFFHRHCFKCHYCNVLLRLGNYIYDREGRYGGKFFCIPHFGVTGTASGGQLGRRAAAAQQTKLATADQVQQAVTAAAPAPSTRSVLSKLSEAVRADMEDRGTTPERVEFENSLLEQGSDEEDYLSEEEWTDRNFGLSANELDDSNDSEDDEYTDSSEEQAAPGEAVEEAAGAGPAVAQQQQQLPSTDGPPTAAGGSWQTRYHHTRHQLHDSESDIDSDDYSEEYGAEGDESHTATEGECGGGEGDGEEEEEGEEVRRQRERRKQEIKHQAPLDHQDTSDTASDTEIASDESEESDTEIDTDSEFGEDERKSGGRAHEIPTIVIDDGEETEQQTRASDERSRTTKKATPKQIDRLLKEASTGGAEKSASLTSLTDLANTTKINTSPVDQLRSRLLQRTESNEALTQKNLLVRRQYLLGQGSSLPKKSVSTADLGNRFKSFMEKISETQKMLNPAPQPSPAMQAYINSSSNKSPVVLSPVSPLSAQKLPLKHETDSSIAVTSSNVPLAELPAKTATTDSLSDVVSIMEQEASNGNMDSTQHSKSDTSIQILHDDHCNIDFGEDTTEEKRTALEDATNSNLIMDDVSLANKSFSHLGVILSNSMTGVETVNEELVNRDNRSYPSLGEQEAASNGTNTDINISSQSVKSVPSDVDDLFDILAKDAEDEAVNMFSFTTALSPGDTSHSPTLTTTPTIIGSSTPLEKIVNVSLITATGEDIHETETKRIDHGTHVASVHQNGNERESVTSYEKKRPTISLVSKEPSILEQCPSALSTPSVVDCSVASEVPQLQDGAENSELLTNDTIELATNVIADLSTPSKFPRKASIESLGDTDSAMASLKLQNKSKAPQLPALPPPLLEDKVTHTQLLSANSNVLTEIDALDFMDSIKEDISKGEQGQACELPDSTRSKEPAKEISVADTQQDLESSEHCSAAGGILSRESSPCKEHLYDDMIDASTESVSLGCLAQEDRPQLGWSRYTALKEGLGSSTEESQASVGYKASPETNSSGHSGEVLGSSSADHSVELTETEDTSHSSISNKSLSSDSKEHSSISESSASFTKYSGSHDSKEALLSSPELVKNIIIKTSKANSIDSTSPTDLSPRSKEETPSHNLNQTNSARNNSVISSTKRYEGYIPRFKDHITAFAFTRNTLDIRKDNRLPSVISDKEKAPVLGTTARLDSSSIEESSSVSGVGVSAVSESASLTSPGQQSSLPDNTAALKKREKNVLNTKKKDGDVVQQLVLSRIARRSTEKTNRRGSRSTLSPLNSSENLLDDSKYMQSDRQDCSALKSSPNIPEQLASDSSRSTPLKACDRSTTSLSEQPSKDPSLRYSNGFQHSPVEAKLCTTRTRANTIGTINRDNKAISLSNLPATPLTHPHQFSNLGKGPRQLFKTSTDTHIPNSLSESGTSSKQSTPINSVYQMPQSTPVSSIISGLDLERSQAREKARVLAKLKSDFDLGLSPPHVPVGVTDRLLASGKVEKSREMLSSDDEANSQAAGKRTTAGSATVLGSVTEAESGREFGALCDQAKEERLRKLLAEQRSRDAELTHKREHREEKVAEKLHEFRVKKDKKSSNVKSIDATDTNSDSSEKYVHKISSRPSLLELESMQVFIKPQSSVATVVNIDQILEKQEARPVAPLTTCSIAPTVSHQQQPHNHAVSSGAPNREMKRVASKKISSQPSHMEQSIVPSLHTTSSPVSPSVVTPPLSTSTPLSSSPPPLTPSQISASKAAATSVAAALPKPSNERKHKSKDRERRRSLIQVFAGMFKSSSDEKRVGESEHHSPTSGSSPPPAAAVLSVPKSPATAVRDKLAKLRLPKTKDKSGKKRSISSEVLDEGTSVASNDARLAFSLPTSPAHHLSSSTTPSDSLYSPNSSSNSALPHDTHYRHSLHSAALTTPPHASGLLLPAGAGGSGISPRIEEESLTDEESWPSPSASSTTAAAAARTAMQQQPPLLTREAQLNRLRQAQEIQRQLQECEAKTRELEERGVLVEKSLRGEPGGECRDETELMSEWFRLVHEKNGLGRWEQELSIRARQLELEDRDARIQQQLAPLSGVGSSDPRVLDLQSIREQRQHLQAMLLQDRLRYVEEDRDLEGVMQRKGLPLPAIRRETGV